MQVLTSSATRVYLSLATPFPGDSVNGRWNGMGLLEGEKQQFRKEGVVEDDASAMKIRRVSTDYTRRASRVVLSCQLPWNVRHKFRRVWS